MNKIRQRQVRLTFDLILNIVLSLSGLVLLAYLAYSYLTPELRDKPFDTSLEKVLGHSGTLIFFLVFGLIMVFVGILAARKTISYMRNKAYLEYKEPPFKKLR